jgi:hypothetical protein
LTGVCLDMTGGHLVCVMIEERKRRHGPFVLILPENASQRFGASLATGFRRNLIFLPCHRHRGEAAKGRSGEPKFMRRNSNLPGIIREPIRRDPAFLFSHWQNTIPVQLDLRLHAS